MPTLDENGSELHRFFSVARGALISVRSNGVTLCRQVDEDWKVLSRRKAECSFDQWLANKKALVDTRSVLSTASTSNCGNQSVLVAADVEPRHAVHGFVTGQGRSQIAELGEDLAFDRAMPCHACSALSESGCLAQNSMSEGLAMTCVHIHRPVALSP